MAEKKFPILEFDADRNALIRPDALLQPIDIAKNCVLCFFGEAIEAVLTQYPHRIAAWFDSESFKFPIYELAYNGGKIALVQAGVGSPTAAAQIEELTALGCKKYIACGSCGVLQKEIALGHLIIPIAAVRDEGTSYHYMPPSREAVPSEQAVQIITSALAARQVPYIRAKTWTTDAFYRETPAKIKQRKQEGCVTVEMEASAFMAAALYNNVTFGQILYAGDTLDGAVWDSRSFNTQTEIREFVLRLALDICLEL